jgi:hypothetical protein
MDQQNIRLSFAGMRDKEVLDPIRELLKKFGWFLIIIAVAAVLGLMLHLLEHVGAERYTIDGTRFLERVLFGCDIFLLFLYIVVTTIREAHKILLKLGIDISLLWRRALKKI